MLTTVPTIVTPLGPILMKLLSSAPSEISGATIVAFPSLERDACSFARMPALCAHPDDQVSEDLQDIPALDRRVPIPLDLQVGFAIHGLMGVSLDVDVEVPFPVPPADQRPSRPRPSPGACCRR